MTTPSAPEQVELLPCPNPWCESHERPERNYTPFIGRHQDDFGRVSPGRRVWCPVCPMSGPARDTEAEAIAAWNHRIEAQRPSPSVADDGNTPPDWLAPLCDLYERTTGDRPKSAGIFQVALATQRPSPAVDVDLVERVAEAIARCDPGNNPAQARLYARAAIATMPDERKLIVDWLQGEAVRHLRASEIADAIERGQHISATVEG